jgi:hypothetical protein
LQAQRTIRKIDTAKGPPSDRGKLVTIMKAGPRRLGMRSFAVSEAAVEDAGYSPPAPIGAVSISHKVESIFWTIRLGTNDRQ